MYVLFYLINIELFIDYMRAHRRTPLTLRLTTHHCMSLPSMVVPRRWLAADTAGLGRIAWARLTRTWLFLARTGDARRRGLLRRAIFTRQKINHIENASVRQKVILC